MLGKTLSHYKILEKIGEGGMGVVYKAQDTVLDRIVALKFLPQYLASDLAEKERFFHEAKAASALNHPNVTVIHEISEIEGQVYIAMEYVDGKTLKQLIETETISLKKIIDIAIQIGEGLLAAHEKQIVHRDIKSDNIKVTPKGQVKIMDFGLAKLKGATKLTKAGSTLGTAAYMSPEQAQGEEVDQRSDIFSFGVVLYEMLTSKLPFGGEHQSAIIYSILNEEPQPLSRFNNQASPKLQEIVEKALAKDKEERYQHVDDLVADLRRERKSLEYAKSSILTQTYEPPKPKKKILKLLIPASVVVVVALLFFILNPFKVEVSKEQTAQASENSLAVMYFENIPDPEDKDHTGEMLTNLLITSLSQVEGLEVISRQRLYDIQEEMGKIDAKKITPTLASKIALRAGVKTMLLGTILQSQPKLAVTSQLIEVKSGRILKSQKLASFSADQIFSMVDSLAILVRNDLKITPAMVTETKSVAEVTTSSPEAYRAYLDGVELNNKVYGPEAEAAFKRAIELDSNFAMAYFRLSDVWYPGGMSDQVARRRALEKAWRLRERVTEKERLRIEAQYAIRIEGNYLRALEVIKRLLQKYPREHNYGALASIYLNLGDYEKAEQALLSSLKQDSLDKLLWNSLGYYYAWSGRKREALQAIDRYLQIAPAEPNPYDTRGDIYSAFGELDSAWFWYQKALSFRSDFSSVEKLGYISLWQQDYEKAEKYFQRYGSTADQLQRAKAEVDWVYILWRRGQLKQARKKMLELLSSHQAQKLTDRVNFDYFDLTNLAYSAGDYPAMLDFAKKHALELKKDPANKIAGRDELAWAWLKNGNPQTAYRIAEELQKEISAKSAVSDKVAVEGCVARLAYEEGKFPLAVEHFEKVIKLVPPHSPLPISYGVFSYGLSLLKIGRLEEAMGVLQGASQWRYDNWVGPFNGVEAIYWLGVAYEQKGEKAKAIQEYEKFLEIWKDADPELQQKEIKDAKERLAKLKVKT